MTRSKKQNGPALSAMDYVRSALANAVASGLSLSDLCDMAEHAADPEKFDFAVNLLGHALNGSPKESAPHA